MKRMDADAWPTRAGPVKWPRLADGALRIRPAHPDDASAWHAIRNAAGPWQSPIQSVAAASALLAEMASQPPFTPGWRQLILEEDGVIVGDIGLNWPTQGDYAEIGFELAPSARGRGLSCRAVRLLAGWLLDAAGLRGVVAITSRENHSAIAALEDAGLLPASDQGLLARFGVRPDEQLHLMARTDDA
jgi:RimJ/RimL family protein N-acetyltransferase